MKELHKSGDWALVLRDNETYLVRHLLCGSYLKHSTHLGFCCICRAMDLPIGQRKPAQVDKDILKMYVFLTGDK